MIEEIVVKSVQRLCIKHQSFANQHEFAIYNIKDEKLFDDENAIDDGL